VSVFEQRDCRHENPPPPRPIARSAFAGFRFPPDVIVLAVRWHLRFGLSYRDIEELLRAPWHRTEQYANSRVECDHGRLKARLRPMRGLKQDRNASVIIAGYAFVQNLRRGHCEVAAEEPADRRVAVAFDELTMAI
jgi:transposase-like protein